MLKHALLRLVGILVILSIVLVACQEKKPERAITAIKTNSATISNADIIRNPITADAPVDTVNVAKMSFDHQRYDYGTVEEGAIVEHTFSFTNTGKAPLIISNAKSTCGCTVPEWPKTPIPVGGQEKIKVKFNTANKKAYQSKPIFIMANTHPSETTLYLIGTVKEKSNTL